MDGIKTVTGLLGSDEYGCSCSLSSRILVTGAYHLNDEIGGAFVWEQYDGIWQFKKLLAVDSGEATDRFGFSVATYNDFILVGAYQEDNDLKTNDGSVYIYNRK